VPLAFPEPRGGQAKGRSDGATLNDSVTGSRRFELREYLCDPPQGAK
jgi:hypothetical protein